MTGWSNFTGKDTQMETTLKQDISQKEVQVSCGEPLFEKIHC